MGARSGPLTARDAAARTFDHLLSLPSPRDPGSWVAPVPRPVPAWTMDPEVVGTALGKLGTAMGRGIIAKARELEVMFPAELDDPDGGSPDAIVKLVRAIAWHFFPRLAGDARDLEVPAH